MYLNARSKIVILLIFLGIQLVYSQKDYAFENCYLNEHIVFPAATGVNYYPVLSANYRKQWATLSHSPQTVILSTNFRLGNYDFYNPKMLLNKKSYFNKENIGLGLAYIHDQNGPLASNKLQASYAYHLQFYGATLSLGLDLNYNDLKVDISQLNPLDLSDPFVYMNESKQYYIQGDLGIQVSNELFFISFAARNLFKNSNLNEYGFSRNMPDYYVFGGATIRTNRYISLEPSAILLYNNGEDLIWSPNLKLYYKSYSWASVSYFSTGSIRCNLVVQILNLFQVGYGYDFYTNTPSRGSSGAHSFYLGRNFGLRNLQGIRKNVKQTFL